VPQLIASCLLDCPVEMLNIKGTKLNYISLSWVEIMFGKQLKWFFVSHSKTIENFLFFNLFLLFFRASLALKKFSQSDPRISKRKKLIGLCLISSRRKSFTWKNTRKIKLIRKTLFDRFLSQWAKKLIWCHKIRTLFSTVEVPDHNLSKHGEAQKKKGIETVLLVSQFTIWLSPKESFWLVPRQFSLLCRSNFDWWVLLLWRKFIS